MKKVTLFFAAAVIALGVNAQTAGAIKANAKSEAKSETKKEAKKDVKKAEAKTEKAVDKATAPKK